MSGRCAWKWPRSHTRHWFLLLGEESIPSRSAELGLHVRGRAQQGLTSTSSWLCPLAAGAGHVVGQSCAGSGVTLRRTWRESTGSGARWHVQAACIVTGSPCGLCPPLDPVGGRPRPLCIPARNFLSGVGGDSTFSVQKYGISRRVTHPSPSWPGLVRRAGRAPPPATPRRHRASPSVALRVICHAGPSVLRAGPVCALSSRPATLVPAHTDWEHCRLSDPVLAGARGPQMHNGVSETSLPSPLPGHTRLPVILSNSSECRTDPSLLPFFFLKNCPL